MYGRRVFQTLLDFAYRTGFLSEIKIIRTYVCVAQVQWAISTWSRILRCFEVVWTIIEPYKGKSCMSGYFSSKKWRKSADKKFPTPTCGLDLWSMLVFHPYPTVKKCYFGKTELYKGKFYMSRQKVWKKWRKVQKNVRLKTCISAVFSVKNTSFL